MDREKVKEITSENPSNFYYVLKSEDAGFVRSVKEEFRGDTFSEKLFRWANGTGEAVCGLKECENRCRFRSFGRGYKEFCSHACKAASKRDCVECENCGDTFRPESGQHDRKFCSRECAQEASDMKAMRETCMERYGSMGFGASEIEEEIRSTMEDRYGNAYFNNRARERETKAERYGDPDFNNLEQAKKTKRGRYGDPYYSNRRKATRTKMQNKYKRVLNSSAFENVRPLFDISDYNGIAGYEKYPFRCLDCGSEFEDHLYSGNLPRCPNCWNGWNEVGASEVEKELREFVESVVGEGKVIANDTSVLGGKELDVLVPDRSLAVEFDGLYWHSEAAGGKSRSYHLDKTEGCESDGVQLVHVFGSEWALKRDVVKSRLRHLLGKSEQEPVHARECEVREVDGVGSFFKNNHLQGASSNASEALGLFRDGNPVSCMSFGARGAYQGTGSREWEIKRFASSVPVTGGASKLFTAFERRFDPWRVVSFADRRWTSRARSEPVYEVLGFEHRGTTDPGYWYFRPGEDHRLRHRFGYRKGVLDEKLDNFDPDLTEWENMQASGWDRIWDCGHHKYVWEAI